jgi:FkbM family methyltransferase
VKFLPTPNNFGYEESHLIKDSNGCLFKLYPNQYLDYVKFFELNVEDRSKLYELISPGSIVLDVGTNNGETLIEIARRNLTGKNYGFEPNELMFSRALENIKLNNITNVNLQNIGLGKDEETAYLAVPGENMGSAYKDTANKSGVKMAIKVMDNLSLPRPINLIKIDVEGFEREVLLGANNIIKEDKPILYHEVNSNHLSRSGTTISSLFDLLINTYNYSVVDANSGAEYDMN